MKLIIDDAHRIQQELGKNTYVKIPSIEEGFEAMRILKSEGANITATASPDVIFSLVKNEAITSAINTFIKDFEKLVGEGKTMKDC